MSYNPLVSVVIPTFNNGHLIERAIISVINQTYQNWELIIIDNYSNDNTLEILNKYVSSKIIFFQIKNNGIISISRNFGVTKSKGDWIAFLDSDDWWKTLKLQECVNRMIFHCDLIYHNMLFYSSHNKITINKSRKIKKPFLIDLLVKNNAIINSSVVLKKSLFYKYGFFNIEYNIVRSEDYNFWLRLASNNCKFEYINKNLGVYYINQNGMSNIEMSKMIYASVSEFLDNITYENKKKVIANLIYSKVRFHFLQKQRKYLSKNLFLCILHGTLNVKIKSLYMYIRILFHKALKNA